jgi:fatty-acyl-CoA synthase
VLFLRAGDSLRKVGTAGTPCFFTDVRLVAPDGEATAPGERGEVQVRGPNVMQGYWQRPDATAEVLDEGGWFRSGDVAIVDEEGYFTIVDRMKDMFISGGENVYPAEVENALHEHPAVADCAVVGVPDEQWGEVGHAFVVLADDASLTTEQMRPFLEDRLARYKIPRMLEVRDTLPRSASGKLSKTELRPTTTDDEPAT